MAEYKPIEPDLSFVREVRQSGGDSLKKCFQCATCSVVCELTPDDTPFPRKEMVWAQWGMVDNLMGDSHVWLCHQCTDCSANCPRGADPAEVMSGIRASLIKRLAVPRFLGTMVNDIAYLPIILLAGVFLLLGSMALFGGIGIPSGEIEYGKFIHHESIYMLFGGGFGLMLLSLVLSGRKFWRAVSEGTAKPTGQVSWVSAVIQSATEFLTHARFRKCNEAKSRAWGHLLVFYGFLGLFIVTGVVAPLAWLGMYPLDLWDFWKVVGNITGVLMCVGVVLLIMNRADREEGEKHAYFNWFFLINILVLGVTGMLLMTLRLIVHPEIVSDAYAAFTYGTYFVHLLAVFLVILLLPFTKFAHLYYRFLAMVHGKMAGIPTGACQVPSDQAA